MKQRYGLRFFFKGIFFLGSLIIGVCGLVTIIKAVYIATHGVPSDWIHVEASKLRVIYEENKKINISEPIYKLTVVEYRGRKLLVVEANSNNLESCYLRPIKFNYADQLIEKYNISEIYKKIENYKWYLIHKILGGVIALVFGLCGCLYIRN